MITGADLEGQITGMAPRQLEEWEMDTLEVPELPALAHGKTFFVGETIACVIATERAIARDAIELIEVDYQPLPPILDPLEGADENSVPVHDQLGTNVTMRKYHDRQGEGLDDAFQQADRMSSARSTPCSASLPSPWRPVVVWPTALIGRRHPHGVGLNSRCPPRPRQARLSSYGYPERR